MVCIVGILVFTTTWVSECAWRLKSEVDGVEVLSPLAKAETRRRQAPLRRAEGFLLLAAAGSMHTTNIHHPAIVVFHQSTFSFLRERTFEIQQVQPACVLTTWYVILQAVPQVVAGAGISDI